MNLDEARKTFFAEADELLTEMEQGLLELETADDAKELINRLFRAAHTIKGSSGIFGFDPIVKFTHHVEGVLDRLRDGRLGVGRELIEVLLQARDHMAELIAIVADGNEPDDELEARGASLCAALGTLTGAPEHMVASASVVAPDVTERSGEQRWHVEWDIGPDMVGHGLDPLALLRYLSKSGRIEGMRHEGTLPNLDLLDPERCYLSLRFDYVSPLKENDIRQAFEFFLDQSSLRIVEGDAEPVTDADFREQPQERQPIEDSAADPLAGPIAKLPKEDKTDGYAKPKAGINSSIRVDAAKLDQLINLVGELVIAGATSNLLARRLGNEKLIETNSMMKRLVEEIRDSALNMRMVQIADTLNRFQRVVHDVSHELGKEVDFVISGGETELDKTVVEKIADPLMHLVRNALDHGIERPDERKAQGKSRKASLALNAFHDSGNIVIQVTDDGRGIDTEKLLEKAKDAGIVTGNQTLSTQEILRLAFEPGISTAKEVTNLSGRGVGLDVVKRNIEALRGAVEIDSYEGRGTRVSIRLPLTLAIIDGFRVGVGGSSYVVPLDTVIECLEVDASADTRPGHAHYINLRGEVLPFVRLRELFHDGEPGKDIRENIVVVSCAGQKAGLVVDELLGEYQTVIKPLGRLFRSVSGLSGATILGSGEVAVILDVPQLIQAATHAAASATQKMAVGA